MAESAKAKANAEVGPSAEADPQIDRKAALAEAMEAGILGRLSSGGGADGIFGGILGGSVGQGFGGLGLSGVGVSGGSGSVGGTIGLGSIGTIGVGGGGTGYGIGSGSSSSNPVSGQSVYAGARSTIELGDAVTHGVSMEAAARALRGRVYTLRDCYEEALDKNAKLAGSASIRLSVGVNGHVAFVRDLGSDLADKEVIACIAKKMKEAYVGVPAGGVPGSIETVIFFRASPKK